MAMYKISHQHLLCLLVGFWLTFSKVYSLKNEELEKSSASSSGHHDPTYPTSRYNSALSAAAAAAASLYPSAMNYYSGSNTYPSGGSSPYNRHGYNGYGSAEPYEKTARDYIQPSNSAGYIDLVPAGTDSGHSHGGGGGGHGHGHGHAQSHGGGWGWGWGHGHGHGHSKLSNSGFGLLGLLGLLSLLQAVLQQMTTTTAAPAMMGRRKRNANAMQMQEESDQLHHRLTQLIFPNLNLIAHASNGNLPMECTHRETCILNAVIIKELGPQGYIVGHHMSGAIKNLLKKVDESEQTRRRVDIAGQNGRKGLNCHNVYPICNELYKNGTMVYPPSLLK